VRTLRVVSGAFALVTLLSRPALAQQRPLVTEDPEPVGAGRVLLEGGVDLAHNEQYPVSGLQGNLLRLPTLGLSIGISSIAELQIDGGFYNRLSIHERRPAALSSLLTVTGTTTHDVEDIVIGTKIRIAPEGVSRPGVGFRFATRLPNAGNESGLGLDTTDFFARILLAKTVQSVRIVGNVGLGILGDPTRGDRQNDVTMYGISFARALTQAAEVVGEINGRWDTRNGEPPPGTESRSVARFGARYTIGGWRADGALLFGLTSRDTSVGVTGGFTYVFNAFQVP